MKKNNFSSKNLASLAMFAALAYITVFFIKIPIVLFLKYEPKDVILAIASFIYGPLAGAITALVVSFVEMITISSTGPIGMVMNFLASTSFIVPASIIYHKNKTINNAVLGLLSGMFTMTVVMLLWNYILTPLYLSVPRSEVVPLLKTAILPFNIFKGVINTGITVLLYKPLVLGLRQAGLAPVGSSVERINLRKSAVIASILIVVGIAMTKFF